MADFKDELPTKNIYITLTFIMFALLLWATLSPQKAAPALENVERKVSELNQVAKNLEDLHKFVIEQKNKVIEVQTIVQGLREEQKEKLMEVQTIVAELKTEQKDKLVEVEAIVQDLTNEQKDLQYLVESDKDIVNAIFKTQEKRRRQEIWLDRILVFAFGVLCAFMGMFVYRSSQKPTKQAKT